MGDQSDKGISKNELMQNYDISTYNSIIRKRRINEYLRTLLCMLKSNFKKFKNCL